MVMVQYVKEHVQDVFCHFRWKDEPREGHSRRHVSDALATAANANPYHHNEGTQSVLLL